MISWIARLCVLCAMSALMQMLLPEKGGAKEGIRLLCGLMMLHLTCKSAAQLLEQIGSSKDLMDIFTCLIN